MMSWFKCFVLSIILFLFGNSLQAQNRLLIQYPFCNFTSSSAITKDEPYRQLGSNIYGFGWGVQVDVYRRLYLGAEVGIRRFAVLTRKAASYLDDNNQEQERNKNFELTAYPEFQCGINLYQSENHDFDLEYSLQPFKYLFSKNQFVYESKSEYLGKFDGQKAYDKDFYRFKINYTQNYWLAHGLGVKYTHHVGTWSVSFKGFLSFIYTQAHTINIKGLDKGNSFNQMNAMPGSSQFFYGFSVDINGYFSTQKKDKTS